MIRALTPVLLMASFALTVAVMLPGRGRDRERRHALARGGAAPVPALGAPEGGARAVRGAAAGRAARVTRNVGGLTKPLLLVVGAACALLMKQPDMGTAMVICFSIGALLIAAGMPMRNLAHDRGRARSSWRSCSRSPSRTGASGSSRSWIRSPTPATAASRRSRRSPRSAQAGFFGVGLGESVQKIFYLPEAHTDMILAIIGEELGLFGILGLISLYGMIGYAGLRAAKLARDRYAKLLAAGITSLILCQATLNFFAVLGMAPLTGVPLPFLSYGSTQPGGADGRMGLLLNVAATAAAQRARRPATARGSSAIEGVAMPTVVIAAGGTAGHVVPALAVADALRARGRRGRVHRRRARRGGARAGGRVSVPPPAGPRASTAATRSGRPRGAARGRATGGRAGLLRRIGADAVIGGGGYVAGPVGLAARILRLPAGAHGGGQPPGGGEPAARAARAPGLPVVPDRGPRRLEDTR